MPVPLLGLASILAREYANSLPTVQQRDDFLKVFSPHTYYGNQLIQYLANTFDPEIGSGLKDAQVLKGQYGMQPYYEGRPENQLSEEEYNTQMAELNAKVNKPDSVERFENYLRDLNFGTQVPGQGKFVGALPEDNAIFQNRVENLAYDLNTEPTSGVPEGLDLERLRNTIYGTNPLVGPPEEHSNQQHDDEYDFSNSISDFRTGVSDSTPDTEYEFNPNNNSELPALTPEFLQLNMAPPSGVDANRDFIEQFNGSISAPPLIFGVDPFAASYDAGSYAPQGGGDFMPQGGGGYMPQDGGYGKNEFDVQQEYEQYLRGGLIQRRR